MNTFKEYFRDIKIKSSSRKKKLSLPEFNDYEDQSMCRSTLQEEQEVQEMLLSIYSYWKVITKRFKDYVALSLRAGCDFDVCTGVRDRLRRVPLEQCDFVDSYLSEDVYIRTKRKQLQQTKERLEKVDTILGGHSSTGNRSDLFKNTMTTDGGSCSPLDALAKSLSSTDPNDTSSSVTKKSNLH